VRYEAVNAMLLNEFLKEHRKVQELKTVAATQAVAITQHQSTISELKGRVAKQQDAFTSRIAQQQKQIEALTATVQKVSEQMETSKPAPNLVTNP